MSLATPEKIRSLQRKLYAAAKADPQRRFHQLYDKMYRDDILEHAYRLARQAHGAAGVDGETFESIKAQGEGEWLRSLQESLKSGEYRPKPVRRVMIPKAGGGERPLGIPTIRDRVAQTAAKLVLEPIFEADFVDGAYGYRPKRSAQDAVREVHQALTEGYTEVVDADLSKYFDTIPHHELMQCVARRVVDRQMLSLIKMWLTVAVEERDADGKRRMTGNSGKGTPQGGVISPLLANIYMHRFLKAWRDQGKGEQYKARLTNYADDFVILSQGHAQVALAWTRSVMERIGLTLNETKTCIRDARREQFAFLGYSFGPMVHKRYGRRYLGAAPSKKAITNLHGRLRQILHRGNQDRWGDVVRQLNQTLRGWQNYFSYGSVHGAYEAVNWKVLYSVQRFLGRRHKVRPRSVRARFPRTTVYKSFGVHRLTPRQNPPMPWAVA